MELLNVSLSTFDAKVLKFNKIEGIKSMHLFVKPLCYKSNINCIFNWIQNYLIQINWRFLVAIQILISRNMLLIHFVTQKIKSTVTLNQ